MDLRFTVDEARADRSTYPAASRARKRICAVVLALIVCGGCETPQQPASPAAQQAAGQGTQGGEQVPAAAPSGFGPAKINILPLSEIAGVGQAAKLNVFVSLLDAFGCSVKAPCTLRFELYEYVRRSAQAKGQRLMIWPDIDLAHPAENQKFWRDFLRAYEFHLDLGVERDKTYVVEVTYLGADGKRLSGVCAIRTGQ